MKRSIDEILSNDDQSPKRSKVETQDTPTQDTPTPTTHDTPTPTTHDTDTPTPTTHDTPTPTTHDTPTPTTHDTPTPTTVTSEVQLPVVDETSIVDQTLRVDESSSIVDETSTIHELSIVEQPLPADDSLPGDDSLTVDESSPRCSTLEDDSPTNASPVGSQPADDSPTDDSPVDQSTSLPLDDNELLKIARAKLQRLESPPRSCRRVQAEHTSKVVGVRWDKRRQAWKAGWPPRQGTTWSDLGRSSAPTVIFHIREFDGDVEKTRTAAETCRMIMNILSESEESMESYLKKVSTEKNRLRTLSSDGLQGTTPRPTTRSLPGPVQSEIFEVPPDILAEVLAKQATKCPRRSSAPTAEHTSEVPGVNWDNRQRCWTVRHRVKNETEVVRRELFRPRDYEDSIDKAREAAEERRKALDESGEARRSRKALREGVWLDHKERLWKTGITNPMTGKTERKYFSFVVYGGQLQAWLAACDHRAKKEEEYGYTK